MMGEYHGDAARQRGQGRASEQRPGRRGQVGHAETGKGLQVAGRAGSGERDRVVTSISARPAGAWGADGPR